MAAAACNGYLDDGHGAEVEAARPPNPPRRPNTRGAGGRAEAVEVTPPTLNPAAVEVAEAALGSGATLGRRCGEAADQLAARRRRRSRGPPIPRRRPNPARKEA
uniref:DUF834 domain-containing protein n=1 Tax=Oryza barthii TaxID=65489 RepID=A0A0D3FGX5_9ORYZ